MIMQGQYSVFDQYTSGARYNFKRYLGQRVRFWRDDIEGVIVAIEPYYTIVEADGREMAGTPTTICPVDKEVEHDND